MEYQTTQETPTPSQNKSNPYQNEFTKRKNWSHNIINELQDIYQVISPAGKILYTSPSCLEIVGYSSEELLGRNITEFIHVDDIDLYIRDLNHSKESKNFQIIFRFRKKDDKFIPLEVVGHPYFVTPNEQNQSNPSFTNSAFQLNHAQLNQLQGLEQQFLNLNQNYKIIQCFFMTIRVSPTKSMSLLNQFLELKIEQEILVQKLKDNNMEPEIFLNPYLSQHFLSNSSKDTTSNQLPLGSNPCNEFTPNLLSSSNPQTSSGSSKLKNPLMELFLEDNFKHRMTNTLESLEPTKVRKKKKNRSEPIEYVCTDCGTVDSPEWRKGPQGPKTLCNACGLRWAKKNRKEDKQPAQ